MSGVIEKNGSGIWVPTAGIMSWVQVGASIILVPVVGFLFTVNSKLAVIEGKLERITELAAQVEAHVGTQGHREMIVMMGEVQDRQREIGSRLERMEQRLDQLERVRR